MDRVLHMFYWNNFIDLYSRVHNTSIVLEFIPLSPLYSKLTSYLDLCGFSLCWGHMYIPSVMVLNLSYAFEAPKVSEEEDLSFDPLVFLYCLEDCSCYG